MSSSSSLHSPQDTSDDKPVGSLDWRQVVGGAGAASIVAYASSRVGIAGTITGAAIMSVLAALTSTYLARAAHQTERQVRRVKRHMGAAASAHAPTAAESSDTGPDAALPHPEPTETSLSPTTDPASSPVSGDNGRSWPWRAIAIFAGAVFAVTIIVVLAVGIATGADQPIAPAAPPRSPAPAVTSESPQPNVTSTPTEDADPSPSPTATSTTTTTSTSTPTSTGTGPAATASPTRGG